MLITFEGGEGSGKSTQIKLLYNDLKKRGLRVFLTREPGGTKIGDEVRKILLDRKHNRMTAVTETLLYMASRAQLVEEVIKPKLKAGVIVLCDRWLDATVAYQGYGAGLDLAWIRSLGRAATSGVEPRLTLFLDVPVKLGLERATRHKAADRMERKSVSFHQKVYAGYQAIARREGRRFRRIRVQAADSVEDVRKKVIKALTHVI